MRRYGSQEERFKDLDALMGAQSAVCFVWAWALLAIGTQAGWISSKGMLPWHAYWKSGASSEAMTDYVDSAEFLGSMTGLLLSNLCGQLCFGQV